MSDIALSKELIDEYVSTLDPNDVDVQRVLSGMQVIHPRLVEELFLLLINQRIKISQLYPLPFNDASISTFISAVDRASSASEDIARARNYIKAISRYREYTTENFRDARFRIGRVISTPKNNFSDVNVDIYGIDRKALFTSVSEVQNKYTKIIGSTPAIMDARSKLMMAVRNLTPIANVDALTTRLISKISSLYFVYSSNGVIRNSGEEDGILIWLLKRRHIDITVTDSRNSLTSALTAMSPFINHESDPTYVKALQRVLDLPENSWADVFRGNINDEASILKDLTRTVFLRYVLPCKIYGSSLLPMQLLSTLTNHYNLINKWLEALYNYANVVSQHIKDKINDPTYR